MQVHSQESESHYLSRKLQASRNEYETSKAATSKLELRLHEASQLQRELEASKRQLQATLTTSEEQNAEQAKKVQLQSHWFYISPWLQYYDIRVLGIVLSIEY